MREIQTDVLVIGGGLAGCQAAIRMRQLGLKVTIAEKQHIQHSGEACMGLKDIAVLIPGIHDKQREIDGQHRATEGLVDESFAELVLDHSYAMVERLEQWGIQVRNDQGEFTHDTTMWWSCNLYIWDGANLKKGHARQCRRHKVEVINRVMITDLLVEDGAVVGAVGVGVREGELYLFRAKATLLSAGSCVRLYQSPSGENYNRWRNPYQTGDGYAAGLRAGARLKHMEFVMGTLVPKDFSAPGINAFIGVGAKLLNARGERFMGRYAGEPMEKAPRQLLAYAVYQETKEGRSPIFVDFRDLPEEKIQLVYQGFRNEKPTYRSYLEQRQLDIRRDLLEIEVSEPYIRGMMTGGLVIDHDFGATLPGLFAVGDVTAYSALFAASGAMTLGWLAGERLCQFVSGSKAWPTPSPATLEAVRQRVEEPLQRKDGLAPGWIEANLQRIMSSYVQYERNETGLTIALQRIRNLREYARSSLLARDAHELVKAHEVLNMLDIAEAVTLAARERQESRMYLNHRRTDFPERDDRQWRQHLILQQVNGEMHLTRQPV